MNTIPKKIIFFLILSSKRSKLRYSIFFGIVCVMPNSVKHRQRFQYTREAFKNRLKDLGFTQSMSRVSRCIDNGPMESFQGIMKDEIKILYSYKTVDKIKRSTAMISQLLYKYQTAKKVQRKNSSTGKRRSYAFITARTLSNAG